MTLTYAEWERLACRLWFWWLQGCKRFRWYLRMILADWEPTLLDLTSLIIMRDLLERNLVSFWNEQEFFGVSFCEWLGLCSIALQLERCGTALSEISGVPLISYSLPEKPQTMRYQQTRTQIKHNDTIELNKSLRKIIRKQISSIVKEALCFHPKLRRASGLPPMAQAWCLLSMESGSWAFSGKQSFCLKRSETLSESKELMEDLWWLL